jgi:hypothetical protein
LGERLSVLGRSSFLVGMAALLVSYPIKHLPGGAQPKRGLGCPR